MSEEANQINSYRIPKIPPFWACDPETWFMSVEASFSVARISDDTTKFHIILANADASILAHIKDLVRNPPAQGKYEALKERILSAFSVSQNARLRQLLKGQVLGDKRPSHFLQELKNLAGDQVTDTVIKTLFVEQLPENYRVILATIDEPDLDKVANIADRIADSLSLSHTLAPVGSSTNHETRVTASTNNLDDDIIEQLAKRIGEKLQLWDSRARQKSPGHAPRPARHRSRSRSQEAKCFYHRKFGVKANKCLQPCGWKNINASQEN